MGNRLNRRQFVQLTGATGVAALAGCAGQEASSDGNSTADGESADSPPDPTSTDTALIEPETLKEWQDAGLVNLEELDERERVVVMRVWETDTYADGHVPGALKWDATEFHAKRLEGLANAAPLVPNGEQMDEILQRNGVCPRTTIVLSGPSALRTARAYWTLRYWGFPRERVKILNGGYSGYEEAYELSTGEEPEAPAANFSVQANEERNGGDRLSMAQMLQRTDLKQAGDRDDVFLDNRPDPSTTIATAISDDPANYINGDGFKTKFSEGGTWLSADAIESHIFGLDGVSDGDTIVTYCGSGYRATMGYFALDGIMGYDDVTVYDGSMGQWTDYDGNNDAANTPPDTWRVDLSDRTNGDTGDSDLDILVDDPPALDTAAANQIDVADAAYMSGDMSAYDDPVASAETTPKDGDGDGGGSDDGGGGSYGCSG